MPSLIGLLWGLSGGAQQGEERVAFFLPKLLGKSRVAREAANPPTVVFDIYF